MSDGGSGLLGVPAFPLFDFAVVGVVFGDAPPVCFLAVAGEDEEAAATADSAARRRRSGLVRRPCWVSGIRRPEMTVTP